MNRHAQSPVHPLTLTHSATHFCTRVHYSEGYSMTATSCQIDKTQSAQVQPGPGPRYSGKI